MSIHFFYFCILLVFFLPIEQLSCPKLPFTRLLYVNVHPENSRISFFFFFFSFFYVGHTSSRGFQWRKVQSAICLRQVRAGLGLFNSLTLLSPVVVVCQEWPTSIFSE